MGGKIVLWLLQLSILLLLRSTSSRRDGRYVPFIRQIAKFSTLAKLTQAQYGAKSQPAILELRKKTIVVHPITNQRTTISTAAHPG